MSQAQHSLNGVAPAVQVIPDDALVFPDDIASQNGDGPRFGDEVWDFDHLVYRANEPRFRIDWRLTSHLAPQAVTGMREYLFARTRPSSHVGLDLVVGARRIKPVGPGSTRAEFYRYKQALNWLETERSVRRMSDVEREDWIAFFESRGAASRPEWYAFAGRLWAFKGEIPTDPLGAQPPSPTTRPVSTPSGENSTPRIPESILAPLIRAALDMISARSDRIIANAQAQAWVPEVPVDMSADQRLEALLNGFRSAGVPLPGSRYKGATQEPAVSLSSLARMLSVDAHWFTPSRTTDSELGQQAKTRRELVASAAADLGVIDTFVLADAGAVEPTSGHPTAREATLDARMLWTACLIVTAYLSGMRDSEVKSLRTDCVSVKTDEEGNAFRWYVHGMTYKGRGARGEPSKWVVTEHVASAIDVLTRLGNGRSDLLFIHPSPPPATSRSRTNRAMLTTLSSRWLKEFVQYVNERSVETIPEHNGKPWPLHLRQLRRTLAWHIANRPFGVVAGALQYQHHSLLMFEGYAGTSASGFQQELRAEREIAQEVMLVELVDVVRNGDHIGGRGGAELEDALRATLSEIGPLPGVLDLDGRRLGSLLRGRLGSVYPGVLASCWFTPERALCVADTPLDERTRPILNRCRPGSCSNAVITPANREVVEVRIAELKVYRRHKLSDGQRQLIDLEVKDLEALR